MASKVKQLIFLLSIGLLTVVAISCNAKSEDDETEIVVTPATVSVKNFYLKANDSVMAKLDSVKFSIDLNSGVIFNADSLPKGTDVTRLIPVINFSNTMTKAELIFLKDNLEKVASNYLTNPEDSVDFTHPVTLDVTAEDGTNSFTYQIKVNVHKVEPDTLMWDRLSVTDLPSRFPNPVAQKTVVLKDVVYTMIEEYNGEYTLSTSTDLNYGVWTKNESHLNFSPQIETLSTTTDSFGILDTTGNLYTSEDLYNWIPTGLTWSNIIGGYQDYFLGLKSSDDAYLFTQYPLSEGITETPIEEGFPVSGYSSLGVVDTEWYPQPFAVLAGGVTEEGNLSNVVWGYDGSTWAVLNDRTLPSVAEPMMVRYVIYRDTPTLFQKRELDIWLFFGGIMEDGEMNRSVYMSYDNGVTWIYASESMQLPEFFPSLSSADLIVADYRLNADLAEAWTPQASTKAPLGTRVAYEIEGTDIYWNCPYLYVFGGYDEDNNLSVNILRGVIARLEFTPNI